MKKYIGLTIVCLVGALGTFLLHIPTWFYFYGFIIGGIAMCVTDYLDDNE